MKDFFISYTSADEKWATWIAWQLEVAGYTTILQAWDFRPAHNFMMEMDEASKKTERTIAILSPDYFESDFCKLEAFTALVEDPASRAGKLLPIRVREFEKKGLMRSIVYIDLMGLEEEAANKALLDGVKFDRVPSPPPGFPGLRSVTEKPRFPGALPDVWNVPFNRNPNFTGRRSLLTDLHAALNSGQYAALTQAIVGLGGVGKTQLALEYVYSYIDDYEIVWWLRSEEPSTLVADYVGLAAALNLPESRLADQNIVVEAVRRKLGQLEGWLLIFDNAAKPERVDPYLPQGGRGHVIITSRNPNWGGTAKSLPVNVFSRDESIEFLCKRTRQQDGADALADALGDLPLALEQAGAYIDSTMITLADYLKRFQQKKNQILKRYNPIAYSGTVGTTWEISFQQLQNESTVGANMLNLIAFLASDNIPKSLLIEGALDLFDPLEAAALAIIALVNPDEGIKSLIDPIKIDDAIAALKKYSLVTVTYDYLSVHKLVQTSTRNRMVEDEKTRWAKAAILLMNNTFPRESYDIRKWPKCSLLLPHALVSVDHAITHKVAPEAVASLLNEVGIYLQELADYARAKLAFERTLRIRKQVHGSDHPDVAIGANNLGVLLLKINDLQGAVKYFEEALRIFEKEYGPDHPKLGGVINNISAAQFEMGNFKGAKKNVVKAMKIHMKSFGTNSAEVASDLNNLGSIMWKMKNFRSAKKILERALKIDENVFGPDHPSVARDANNLGLVLHALLEYENAKNYHEIAMRIEKKLYGADHPYVARDANNLGSVLEDMGDLEKAKNYYEQAMLINTKVYGPDSREVAMNLNNLGKVLNSIGDPAGTKNSFESALKIFREILGDAHPDTVKARNNLETIDRCLRSRS